MAFRHLHVSPTRAAEPEVGEVTTTLCGIDVPRLADSPEDVFCATCTRTLLRDYNIVVGQHNILVTFAHNIINTVSATNDAMELHDRETSA